jgi:aldehyde:ferredoxin oxidoreductase
MNNELMDVKLLRINLSTGEIKKEKVDLELVKKYLGGRGLASKILKDEVDPKIDPLSEENKLIFSNGLLTGTAVPTGGRYMVVTKGPLTGTIASSNSGGFFGAELRKAGWSYVVFEGKADKPVYIAIKDDNVEIKDASHLWGKTTDITTDELVEEFGEKSARVACIGPAGEKLVKFAAIINDKARAAGRTGVGAVMGSKNLKAVIVKGSERINVMDKAAFMDAVKSKVDMIRKNPVTGEALPQLGTKVLDSIVNQGGLYPTKNFQFGTFEFTEEVNGEALVNKGYLINNTACYACPIGCGREVVLPNGRKGEGPEYESAWAFGADCGVKDLIAVTDANFMCNELGLDTISAGTTIAAAIEMFEKGYIPKDDLENGPELRYGSSESLLYYLKKIAYRDGIGDKLAEGSYRFCEGYGHPELSMSVKKQELPAYDPRGVQGHGLEYATSNRGGCHVRGYMISPEVLGVPEKLDPQSLEGKAGWVKIFQDLTAVIDSAGLCLFSSFALGADDYAELINVGTGFGLSTDEVLKIGERIWNLEKQFNLEAGIAPEEDRLPDRFEKEPIPDGPQKGVISHYKELLPEYYKLRGWDEKGIIPQSKLKELEIA